MTVAEFEKILTKGEETRKKEREKKKQKCETRILSRYVHTRNREPIKYE